VHYDLPIGAVEAAGGFKKGKGKIFGAGTEF